MSNVEPPPSIWVLIDVKIDELKYPRCISPRAGAGTRELSSSSQAGDHFICAALTKRFHQNIMVLFIYRPSILYLIKIKTKRGHCTGTGDPWSHILGNTVQVHTVTRQQRNEWAMRKMVFKLPRWGEVCISGLCCQPRPRPAHSHFLCILTD